MCLLSIILLVFGEIFDLLSVLTFFSSECTFGILLDGGAFNLHFIRLSAH